MFKLQFPKDLLSALPKADALLVLAPKAGFQSLPRSLGRDLIVEIGELARANDVGRSAGLAETLSSTELSRVLVGVLPDRLSRYNSPTRAHAIGEVVAKASPSRFKKLLVLALVDRPEHAVPALNAVARRFPLFSRKSKKRKAASQLSLLAYNGSKPIAIDASAKELLAATREAAKLVDMPAAELDTRAFAREAKKLLSKHKSLKVQEIVGKKLAEGGFGGIYGVGRCALSAPRLFHASYRPRSARGPQVALVGKGVVYDTGGLSLKSSAGMCGMKGDMGGAAAMLGAFHALVSAKVKTRIDLVLCMAENMIGPEAIRPDDILTMHSGKTVEINNTDAEGRLLLADGCSFAARKLGADIVIDAATLTGAQSLSTGLVHAAIMSNDAELEQQLLGAGQRSGELTHPLMFAPELYQREFSSAVADMRNSVKNRRNAQCSCAGQFIYSHVESTGVRWGHIDLAGPAMPKDRGTGFGVGLVTECVKALAE